MRNQIKSYVALSFALCLQMVIGQEKEISQFKPAEIITGTLANGMHYYIMHNEEPKERASFYFAQNVGSIQEESTQRGLAHFLEHMAFNGTKHFKDKQMVEYLEKNGVKFGNEINAFTVYDETVYSIKNVPVQNERLLDSVLLILHDWSGSLTLSDKEIDNERGVVREEWRSRYNPRIRTTDSVKNQGLLVGSKYARRSPIGTMDVINNFKYEELKDYYEDWYRPDLQAVIVVGDMDAEKMEKKIKATFSSIPLRDNLPKRKSFTVPIGDDFTYLKVIDKELGTTDIEYYIKYKADNDLTEKEVLENNVKYRMISSIFNQRLSKLSQLPSSPVYVSRFGIENVVRPLDVLKITMQPKRDSLLPALQFALTEYRRLMLYGATPQEFNRVKASMERGYNNGITKKGSSSIYHAIKIYEAFFKKHQLPDYNWGQRYELAYLKELTNQDLHNYFKQYNSTKGNVLAIKGTDEVRYPSKAEVLAVLNTSRSSNPDPYKEITYDKKLKELELPGADIVREEKLKNNDGIRYTLSNGARISLFVSPNKGEEVYFEAVSPGGKSLLEEAQLPNAKFVNEFASASGLANLNKMELRASTEVVTVKTAIDDYEESLSGYSNSDNLEKLFKGIYLAFTAPRFDDEVFEGTKESLENLQALIKGNVQSDFIDALQLARSNYSPREMLFSKELLGNLSMQAMEAVYRDRISNASDFDFVFMGNMETEGFLELVKKYIGSIPGNNTTETAINHHMIPPVGIHKVHLKSDMQTPQGTVNIYFMGDLEYNNENKLLITVIEQLLNKRYLEKIREEEGGTYGVRVKGGLQHLPEDRFILNISFNCNPEKTDRLVSIVYEELQKLSKEINSAELHEIKSSLNKETEEKKGYNKQHFETVMNSFKNNVPLLSVKEVLKRIDAIADEDIINLAKQIIDNPRIVEGVLKPIDK